MQAILIIWAEEKTKIGPRIETILALDMSQRLKLTLETMEKDLRSAPALISHLGNFFFCRFINRFSRPKGAKIPAFVLRDKQVRARTLETRAQMRRKKNPPCQ